VNAGLEVWCVGDSQKVLLNDKSQIKNFIWDSSTNTVKVKGAKNEYVSFQIVMKSDVDLPEVKVEADNFLMDIELFEEFYVNCNGEKYPDALIPFKNPYSGRKETVIPCLNLKANENCVVWVDIFIPENFKGESYKGIIRITGKDIKKEINVELTVWNFTIPKKKHIIAYHNASFALLGRKNQPGKNDFYGRENIRLNYGCEIDDECWEVLKNYFTVFHEHNSSLGLWRVQPKGADKGNPIWTNYDKYMKDVITGRLFRDKQPPSCWLLPFREKDHIYLGYDTLRKYAKEVAKHWRENGWDLTNSFAYFIDEPRNNANDKNFEVIKEVSEIIREAGLKFAVATHMPKGYMEKEDFYTIGKYVDWIWFSGRVYYPDEVKKLQAKGVKCHIYQSGGVFPLELINTDGVNFRAWCWIAYKYGADGVFHYDACQWGFKKNPYLEPNEYDESAYGNGIMVYPGYLLDTVGYIKIKGPVTSFRLKALRRGVFDYEYFYLAKQKGIDVNSLVSKVIRDALANSLGGWEDYDRKGDWSINWEDYDRVRYEIGEQLNE